MHSYKPVSENELLTEKLSGYRPITVPILNFSIWFITYTNRPMVEKILLHTIFSDISKYYDKIWHAGLLC